MIQPKLLSLTALLLAITCCVKAQTIPERLAVAFQQFQADPQLQNALVSLYVVDDSGRVVFNHNETIGLAPASTQKIITSATAYELLGKDFTYKTDFGFYWGSNYTKTLYIKGSGDPTLGSWRWTQTKDSAVLGRISRAASKNKFDASVVVDTSGWDYETIPGGWIWDDIGNYYGAGAGVFNWRENQYDIVLHSSNAAGEPVSIVGINPHLSNYVIRSSVSSAAAGSGDNAYAYFSPGSNTITVRGTIPVHETNFTISAAVPDPVRQFRTALLHQLGIAQKDDSPLDIIYKSGMKPQIFYTHISPPLDSIIYWLNRKSINLYAEALLKTIAFQKSGKGSTEVGIDILKSFWKEKGIPITALNLVDGSGLSPLNRVTTQAQVTVLQYAKKQPWFAGFYKSLPEYNGMKLKSGTIGGVKGFAGYHTSRAGVSYTLSFLVNNYNGEAGTLVKKMYAVLDVLK